MLASSKLRGGCAGQDLGASRVQGCVQEGVKTTSLGGQRDALL